MLSSEGSVRILCCALQTYYPNAVHAFFCGSAAHGQYRPYSDLDVIVTARMDHIYERRCVMFEGYPIDFQVLSLRLFDQIVRDARSNAVGHALQSLANGHIIVDADGNAATIQRKMAEIYAAGPSPPAPMAIKMLKMFVCEAVIDLATLTDRNELIATGLSMFEPLAKLDCAKKAGWLSVGKHYPRELRRIDPDGFDPIASAYAELLDGRPDNLIAFAMSVVDAWGGLDWERHVVKVPARRPVKPPF